MAGLTMSSFLGPTASGAPFETLTMPYRRPDSGAVVAVVFLGATAPAACFYSESSADGQAEDKRVAYGVLDAGHAAA